MRERFNAAGALAPLKPFQRATVDHVMRRLMSDPDAVRHFLVADEVGLGKTMVARGVIAKMIEALQPRTPRIDIVYICSNGAIARQNVEKLNVLNSEEARIMPTRLTLLALELARVGGIQSNGVNIFSLTPGTSLYLTSGSGTKEERALILRMIWPLLQRGQAVISLFQCHASLGGWRGTRNYVAQQRIEESVAKRFRDALKSRSDLLTGLERLASAFVGSGGRSGELNSKRDAMVGELRRLLAEVSADALEPNLIILDEFQRFQDLLKDQSDAAALARRLFNYADKQGNSARTLLLSATPYRMLSLAEDEAEAGDHYSELMAVVSFLYGKDRGLEICAELESELRRFRRAMQRLPEAEGEARSQKEIIENRLRGIIARTERVSETRDSNAMTRDRAVCAGVEPGDLRAARAINKIAAAAGAQSPIEYWKSAPWLLSFMRDYDLDRRIAAQADSPSPDLLSAMKHSSLCQLNKRAVNSYQALVPPNGRMRKLSEIVFSEKTGTRLWMPPTLPYFGPAIAASKTLIFSQWTMVPDAIAGLLSHESERLMGMGKGHSYSKTTQHSVLVFGNSKGRLNGLRALPLVLPSPHLAALGDPLSVARRTGPVSSADVMRREVRGRLQRSANKLARDLKPGARESTWDWAGAAHLDISSESFARWLRHDADLRTLVHENGSEAWQEHLDALVQSAAGPLRGTANKREICDHLADLALGSPATCALRALSRVVKLPPDNSVMLQAATRIGMGFRTLFNLPDAQALLRGGNRDPSDREFYWRAVLRYCRDFDLQAVMDEYAHLLIEFEGLRDAPPERAAERLAEVIVEALSIHPAQIDLKSYSVRGGKINIGRLIRLRGRFATRLAGRGAQEEGGDRTDIVRTAFNSPFRPFVLATTSVGQEGLDFHPWCHRIVHWNLPRNPVDLEQREGRIHRYKNHAVRTNLAEAFATAAWQSTSPDPWEAIFSAALKRPDRRGELDPFWLFEGNTNVERVVLNPPFSREASRLDWLKRSVATYRLAFGQPRQDDLLAWLNTLGEELDSELLRELRIDLRPPVKSMPPASL